jgi:hypothetical protein
MIVYKANHWFEALRPELEPKEKEVFYHHPTLPLKVNQIGVIYFEDEDAIFEGLRGQAYRIRMKKGGSKTWSYVSTGSKARVCYECYHNAIYSGKHFMFKDGNPLNYSKENLVPTLAPIKSKDPEGFALYSTAAKATKRFVKTSVDWMLDKEEWVIKKGGDVKHYWELFGELPTWLQIARLKRTEAPKGLFEYKPKSGNFRNKIPQQEKDKVIALFNSGMTAKLIAEEMGYDSTKRVQVMLRNLKLTRK